MKNIKKPFLFALLFILLIILIHGFLVFLIDNKYILRNLRPIRDILFFPLILVNENTSKIYCWLAKISLLDHGRCLWKTSGSIKVPDGPPNWFINLSSAISFITLIIYYTIIFKIILKLSKKSC